MSGCWQIKNIKENMELRIGMKRKAPKPEPIRTFKLSWEEDYLVKRHVTGEAQCLVCHILLKCKKFNVQRHYNTKHCRTYEDIVGVPRTTLVARLKEYLAKEEEEEQIEKREESEHEAAVRASYNIALTIAKEGRPLTDGEAVKDCLMTGAGGLSLFPSDVGVISLSAQTISRRVRELGADLKGQLKNLCANFVWFSLAVDESVDVNDTAQLAIFIRGVTEQFAITEELLSIVPLRDTTTADDVFMTVEEVLEDMDLVLSKLCSVATDGDNGFGFAEKMREKLVLEGLPPIIVMHSILHPEQFCSRTCTNFDSTLNVVTRCVHFCKKQGFINYDFREFLEDCDSQCRDVSFHCDTRLKSCSKVFQTVFALRKDIAYFMETKGSPEPLLLDDEFVVNLAFLNDMTHHLSELNSSMQGQNHLISSMWDRVRGFKLELLWLEKQLQERNLEEFTSLASLDLPKDYNFSEFGESVHRLADEFDRRFKEVDEMQEDMMVFMTPFFVPYDDAPARLQRELIRLQCNTVLKDRYYATRNLVEFYKNISRKEFPRLHSMASRFMSMFGSTFISEQIFAVMNLNRCKMRCEMSDQVLEAILRLHSAQSLLPNIDALVESKSCQISNIKIEKE